MHVEIFFFFCSFGALKQKQKKNKLNQQKHERKVTNIKK